MRSTWVFCVLAGSAAALSPAQLEHAIWNNGRGLQELDSPFGFSETPKCNRCGKDGPHDYNCCHPGGAWAGVCGDEGMIARGTANYTYAQGFVVCQERLKRFKSFDPFYRPWRHKKRPSKFEPRAPRIPGSLRSTPSTPSAGSVCMIRVHSTCSGFPGAAAWGWFDASRTGGVGGRSRPTCTALSRAWKDACGLTAVVSSWYGSDASILKAIASPVISDQQLRRCLVAPGEDACLAAAMWPTFYTHTLQSCPEGWTMTAMGVCHNPALPWRCPTGWTRLALPPFCSPNGLESESIPSLKCYAVRYADLRGPFCPYGVCDWTGLLRHYLRFGRAERRAEQCDVDKSITPHAGQLVAVAPPARAIVPCDEMSTPGSVQTTAWRLDVRCYLQRYEHVRQRFCASGQLAQQCIAPWTTDNFCAVVKQFVSVGQDQGLRFTCDRTSAVPLGLLTLKPKETRSLHVVVPGHGDPRRTPLLLHSLDTLKRNKPSNVHLSCTIYVYNASLEVYPKEEEFTRDNRCDIVVQKGLWTDFMKMESGTSDYVLVMMDDVSPYNVCLGSMLQTMEQHGIDEFSPSILPSWNWKNMMQGNGALFKRVRMVDTLFAMFKRPVFECWKSKIDLQLNHFGWGYDVAFSQSCNASVAVSDQHLLLHATGAPSDGNKERLYNETETFRQMWAYLKMRLGWKFDGQEQGIQILIAHNDAAPTAVVAAPRLALLDPAYLLEVEHRGGWRTVMQHALKRGVLSVNNRGGQLMLIDCSEKWFVWGGQRPPWEEGVREPWVGMIHSTANLPSTYPTKETMQGLLATPAFVASVPWCRLIIVFAECQARDLRLLLPTVSVVVMYHPIGMEANAVFNMQSFLNRRGKWEVVFLGQQYRRLSTLTRLEVPYPKVWLPGSSKDNNSTFIVKHSRDAAAPKPNLDSFRIAYIRSHDEYDWMLLNNIVVIDVWDAAANNAVLEAIGMNNPVHINKHPAVVEYLGADYPLFYTDVDSLQALLKDEQTLVQRTRLAHEHLVALPKSHFSLDHFATQLNKTVFALPFSPG